MLTLSELLDRIRPTGAPGAPSEGEGQRDRDHREAELSSITALLVEFEAEADAVIAAARTEGDRARSRGRTRAAEIRAAQPGRVAQAQAIAEDRYEAKESDLGDVRVETQRELAHLAGEAQDGIDRLVDRAIELIVTGLTVPGDGP